MHLTHSKTPANSAICLVCTHHTLLLLGSPRIPPLPANRINAQETGGNTPIMRRIGQNRPYPGGGGGMVCSVRHLLTGRGHRHIRAGRAGAEHSATRWCVPMYVAPGDIRLLSLVSWVRIPPVSPISLPGSLQFVAATTSGASLPTVSAYCAGSKQRAPALSLRGASPRHASPGPPRDIEPRDPTR
jgi:hypothetical protein